MPGQHDHPIRLTALAMLASLAVASCSGGGGRKAPKPAPAVTVLSASSCPSGPGNTPGGSCRLLRITAGSNAPLEVEVRVFEPDPSVTLLGTVVLGSGSTGTLFYCDLAGGDQMLADFLAQGLRVVDRRWTSSWLPTGPTLRESAEAYAELLTWIHANVHTTGLFAALGQSAGSSELAYALSSWDRAPLLDVAVLSSGPGMARLDYQCFPPSPTWAGQCPAIVPSGALECGTPLCTAPAETNLCTVFSPGKTPAEMEAESVLFPGAELDYDGTLVHVLIGADDCGLSTAQALLYQQSLLGPSTLSFIPGTPHQLSETAAGRAAQLQAVLGFSPSPAAPVSPGTGFQWTWIEGESETTVRGVLRRPR